MKFPGFTVFVSLLALLMPGISQAEGLTLGATRLIYESGKKESSVPLRNGADSVPWLVQSWVSDFERKNTNVPFITTPPLFKLGQQSTSAIRVVYVGSGESKLPDDRESVFLLNVRAVPAVQKEANPSRLVIATQNIIKLIYRPAGLTAQGAGEAGQKLKLVPGTNSINVVNPTAYVVTLTGMKVNEQPVERPGTLMPFSSKQIKVPAARVRHVAFSTINDYGGITSVRDEKF
ncbi:molecular chaperone [Pantoea sp. MBD-2R]|uniref:fimbrial biogenesis chaperone n=1 Tax=unclassified Pantoea TaxID=2630326 RepID=UPI0011BED351|nr:molecular chaperone [Pantoea sp. CCBC3-3-1]